MGDAARQRRQGAKALVSDTSKPLGRLHAHQATIESGDAEGRRYGEADVDVARRDAIRANHSATHLLHAALRNACSADM
jgi:alanyl-tRNA synthetase